MGMLIWLELVLGALIVRQTMPFKWTFREKYLNLASYAYVYGCKHVKVRSIVGMNMHSREKLYNTNLPIKVENHPNYTPGNQTSPAVTLDSVISLPYSFVWTSYFATVKIPVYFCFILE